MTPNEKRLNDILEQVVQELDIPPHKYKLAMERFGSIKSHLEDGNYPHSTPPPSIYLQGSFRYGTVTRPINGDKDAGFDLDMVCEVKREKDNDKPKTLKDDVGLVVEDYAQRNGMISPEDKRRCWTLKYAPDSDGNDFHVDVLPCLPDMSAGSKISEQNNSQDSTEWQYTRTTIAITNRDDNVIPPKHSWRSSNPNGYAKWFNDICLPAFCFIDSVRQKDMLFDMHKSSEGFSYNRATDIPNELLRTPLQRAIQIMKRHRDIRFKGQVNKKHKPISMIITTLAAQLYKGRASELTTTISALRHIVNLLAEHAGLASDYITERTLSETVVGMRLIQRVGDKWYIPNPVNPHYPGDSEAKGENFADFWHEDNHAKAKAFFRWVGWLRDDLDHLINSKDYRDMGRPLEDAFGESIAKRVMRNCGVFPTVLVSKISLSTDTPKYPKVELPPKPSKIWGI